jgi:outer membrane receptor for ferrienterochelin and colicin
VRKVLVSLVAILMMVTVPVFATIFSTVKGVVHDPQHRPVAGAAITVKARQADWTHTTITDADGAFQIGAVPIGEYTLTVVFDGFQSVEQPITVVSDTVPVLHVQLELAGVREAVTVSAGATDIHPGSVTPTTLVSRLDIQDTPGADRTNGLEAITAYVPGAYVTHDQLHMRGGHQVSWLIDGVPVPNTNIASNVGPQFDPKDIDFLEVHRGSYDAQYGDRTYGVFNVVPRSGFERNNDAELVVSAGNFYQTNDQLSVGGHTQRFAYFVSGNGNRSDLGLGTPVADVIHDRQAGGSGFASLIFNLNPANQLRVVTSVRHDSYQIPNGPDDQAAGINDVERESDAFVNVSWVRTFPSGALLTVSPFYHYNTANFEGGPNDPIVTVDERQSQYGGAQATLSADVAKNNVQVGFYGFHQHDDQLFALTFNDGSNPDLSQRETPSGNIVAVFIQDKVNVASWLTLTAGLRQTHFSGAFTEDATSPRVGASLQIPSVNWIVRGFYGRFYQGPPLITASGPLLGFVTAQNLGFIPLHGERDEEYQVGVTVPMRGWTADVDRFQTTATNFFDHNPVGNSNVFFPITIDGALIKGTEVTVRSPRTWPLGQFHLAYSYQTAQGRGSISGGLTDFSTGGGYFLLDHDQRNTLSAGFDTRLPRGVFAAANVYYGSGFTDSGGPAHLPGHTTINVSLRKSLGGNLSAAVTALNVADSHLLTDNSLTFGGTHFNNPREVYGELRYRFHVAGTASKP